MEFKELGHEIATLRKQKKVTQQQLSNDLNISRATISGFENGSSSDIGLKKLIQLADYLGYELIIKEKSPFPIFEELVNG
jgi:transcriptional regulator with XRE-family HTH domain